MEFLRDLIEQLWNDPAVKFILVNILINTALAVALSLRDKTFDLKLFGAFLWDKIVPYGVVYAVARAVGDLSNLGWLAPAVFAIIEAQLLGKLAEHLSRLGIPVPAAIQKLFGNPVTADIRPAK